MTDTSQTDYYKNNLPYTNFLSRAHISSYSLYIDAVKKYAKPKNKLLDVGCGPGLVVDELCKLGYTATGVDVSLSSINQAKKSCAGKYFSYDGRVLPFTNNAFDLVGSYAVAEHVEDLNLFLNESVRVLKPQGFLILFAPNFLSVTSSYHYTTAGVYRKIQNICTLLYKLARYLLTRKITFDKFLPIVRPDFHPDDDAVNLVNLVDVIGWGLNKKLVLVDYSGAIMPDYLSYTIRHVPFINLFAGGVFVVFQKL